MNYVAPRDQSQLEKTAERFQTYCMEEETELRRKQISDGWEREGDQAEKGLFWDSDSALHDSHTCQSTCQSPSLSSLSCKPWPLGNEVSIAMRESKPTSMVPEEAVPVREEEHMGIPALRVRACV